MWEANPFLHPAWLDGHASVLEPELIEVEAEGIRLVRRADGPLRLLGDRLSDRLDIDPQAVSTALASRRGRAARLRRLPCASAEAVARATPGAQVVERTASPTVSFAGRSWEDYLDGPDARRRRRIAAAADRLLDQPGATVSVADRPEAIAAALDHLVALHQLRFGDRSRSFEPAKVAFLATALPAMAADGAASIRVLELEGRPVAAILVLLGERAWWFHQSGWDPALADRSVGRAVLADALRAACAQGCDFHLLCGDHDYKGWWATDDLPVATVEVAGC